MIDTFDIIVGIIILGIIIALMIDSHKFDKKIKKQREERNAERIKQGREPIDYDAPSSSSYGSVDSEAADSFRSTIFRNMGGLG